MNFAAKGALTLAFVAGAAFSNATLNYSNIVAQVTFDGTQTYNLNVLQNGNSLDFSALNYPMYVSTANSLYSSAVVTITYDVTSDKGINGLNLVFTGMTFGNGTVDYSETVKDGIGNVLDSVSGTKSGNAAFSSSDSLSFASQTAYSVEKSFTLSLGQSSIAPVPSFASIGLIEQNAVPEPATLGAVGVGLVSLLARRRRK